MMASDGCRIVGVHPLTYRSCRAANPDGQYFKINQQCPVGQVINIQSAEAGYSVSYKPDAIPPQCPWGNCTRSTDVPASLCNGRRSCRIRQSILIYPQGSVTALCRRSKDGNFIRIEFTCVKGKFIGIMIT